MLEIKKNWINNSEKTYQNESEDKDGNVTQRVVLDQLQEGELVMVCRNQLLLVFSDPVKKCYGRN